MRVRGRNGGDAAAAAEIQYQKVTVAQEDGRAIEKMRRDVVLVRGGEVPVARA